MPGADAIAERYAAALFELADERKQIDPVAEDLAKLSALRDQVPDFAALLRNPLIPRAGRVDAMAVIGDPLELGEIARNLLGVLATKGRLFVLPGVIRAFLAEVARRRGEVTALVTTATAMSEAQVQAVTDILKDRLGARVSLETRTDPALLGGMVVRVGSRLIDASLKTKLDRLEVAMKG